MWEILLGVAIGGSLGMVVTCILAMGSMVSRCEECGRRKA
jgi:hypothetical protein